MRERKSGREEKEGGADPEGGENSPVTKGTRGR